MKKNIIKWIKEGLASDSNVKELKISVVIPTYNTDPDALARLVNSIDKQTMPKNEYEVIFVDDGSTTDIYEKIKALAASRSNVIAKRIPNSGWGSRPRNIGTKMARGIYILYMDHDDTIFPEAFERVYRLGVESNADIVNPKEVRTKGWAWGWNEYTENIPSAEKLGIKSLLPMTPHKFYRREFLLKNGIEFNEGARVLWEDVYFNTKAFSCGAAVAILSDYPTYYWIATGANNSSSFGRDPHEKWGQIHKLISFFIETLSDKEDLNFMLKHWYQSRVLGILGAWLLDKSQDRILKEFEYAKKVADELIPPSIDEELTPNNKVRAYLLRNGKIDELIKLAKFEQGLTARSYAKDIKWVTGKLKIHTVADMTFNEKTPYILHSVDNQVIRNVPEEVKELVPVNFLNLTEELTNATYEPSLKGRNSRETWKMKASHTEVIINRLNETELTIKGNLIVDVNIQNAAMGAPLNKQPWDIATRFSAVGHTFHRGIVAPEGYAESALINGKTAVSYRNNSEMLTLDIGSKVHSVVAVSSPTLRDLATENHGNSTTITINLPKTHVYGNTKIKGTIELIPTELSKRNQQTLKETAYLIGDENGARVVTTIKLPVDSYRLTTIFEGKRYDTGLLIKNRVPVTS